MPVEDEAEAVGAVHAAPGVVDVLEQLPIDLPRYALPSADLAQVGLADRERRAAELAGGVALGPAAPAPDRHVHVGEVDELRGLADQHGARVLEREHEVLDVMHVVPVVVVELHDHVPRGGLGAAVERVAEQQPVGHAHDRRGHLGVAIERLRRGSSNASPWRTRTSSRLA